MTPISYIDSHCHLYDEVFTNDISAIYDSCINNGVGKVLMPNIDLNSMTVMNLLRNKYPNWLYCMLGLHPCYIDNNWKKECTNIFNNLKSEHYIAIGEIGLDFYHNKDNKIFQEQALHFQIELAVEKKLPIVLHSRNALRETLNIVKQYKSENIQGVFHCFSENYDLAKNIFELNFFIGIGGVVTFKKSTLPEYLKDISLNHILLETDAPYLTPHPFRKKRNSPEYIPIIAEKIANIKHVSKQEVASITTLNAKKLFNI